MPLDDCASCGEMFYSDDPCDSVCAGCQIETCEVCPCCGRETGRLSVMTHRNGRSREVCPVCEERLRNADRDAWRWFHHGSLLPS